MNNFIEYFYNIKTTKISFYDKYYLIYYNNYLYKLCIYEDNIDLSYTYELNKKMQENTLVSEIIKNKYDEIISNYNNINYILLKIYINTNKLITLSEINYLNNSLYTSKININWGLLWERKIDYLEEMINENGKKYPLIVDSFNYFVGLAENAISYYNNITIDKDYKYYISHKKILPQDKIDSLYNPLNIVFDYKVRDIAEYIKNSFFNNNKNIFIELEDYLKKNNLSITDINLLVSRILYPSFYFNMYEDIIIDNKEEKILLKIISRIDEYEDYLAKIINYFHKKYQIDEILWLKKEIVNPR